MDVRFPCDGGTLFNCWPMDSLFPEFADIDPAIPRLLGLGMTRAYLQTVLSKGPTPMTPDFLARCPRVFSWVDPVFLPPAPPA